MANDQGLGFTLNRRYAGGIGGTLNTQPVVSTSSGTTTTRDTRTQTPFELASGIASAAVCLGFT